MSENNSMYTQQFPCSRLGKTWYARSGRISTTRKKNIFYKRAKTIFPDSYPLRLHFKTCEDTWFLQATFAPPAKMIFAGGISIFACAIATRLWKCYRRTKKNTTHPLPPSPLWPCCRRRHCSSEPPSMAPLPQPLLLEADAALALWAACEREKDGGEKWVVERMMVMERMMVEEMIRWLRYYFRVSCRHDFQRWTT